MIFAKPERRFAGTRWRENSEPLKTMPENIAPEITPESGLIQPQIVRQDPRPEDLTPGIRGFDCGDCGKPVEPRYASKKCDGWHWHDDCWERLFAGYYVCTSSDFVRSLHEPSA